MLIDTISVVMIAKDAEVTIKESLESLVSFKEVILYLNNSSDKTKKIAQTYPNVKIVEGEFIGFGPTKNRAASYAANDWVFFLDSDEVLSEDLVDTLKGVILDKKSIYTIYRINYYKSQQIKHCWGDDVIVRLYHRQKTSFTDSHVHEKIIESDLTKRELHGVVRHYPYATISDFVIKADRYSTLFAQNNVGKKSSSPLKAILNAKYSFIKTYIFKLGFLDGYAGLVIAFSHMVTNFYKYIKLYEANKELKK